MEGTLLEVVEQALEVRPLSRTQALWVLSYPEERVVEMVTAVHEVRHKFFGDRVKLNALVNVKSGLCPEDCNYCSQSKISTAEIQKLSLIHI